MATNIPQTELQLPLQLGGCFMILGSPGPQDTSSTPRIIYPTHHTEATAGLCSCRCLKPHTCTHVHTHKHLNKNISFARTEIVACKPVPSHITTKPNPTTTKLYLLLGNNRVTHVYELLRVCQTNEPTAVPERCADRHCLLDVRAFANFAQDEHIR